MKAEDYTSKLESRGVKPTSTRLLVYRALAEHHHALSLRELDDVLDTVDRSHHLPHPHPPAGAPPGARH